MESRQIFNEEVKNRLLFSNLKIDPSISPFIKSRFDIITSSESYTELLDKVEKEEIQIEGFKAEYLVLDGDSTPYKERLQKLRDIGHLIEGEPDYYTPTRVYSICYYEGLWYFGVLNKHNADWLKHKQKPRSFSNSIGMHIAKTLVSIASKGEKSKTLLDACCGVGTIMLEACISGFDIEGCEISENASHFTKQNLVHYHYSAHVYCSDVNDLSKNYDAVIVDLPYNLYTYSDDLITSNIIESAAKLTNRLVIVSMADIENQIKKSGMRVIDFCTVEKRGTTKFARKVWVCEKVN